MTQYDVERRFAAWRREGADPSRSGAVADWLVELEGDRLVLNPFRQRWFCFDAGHGQWLDSGIVPGEAVFVSLGGVLGAKRALSENEVSLPLEERIEQVCRRVVGALDGVLVGPLDPADARALAAARPGSSLHVWSARDPQWQEIAA